ncbi:hypothetical protein [Streptosporangium sp. 'caverna']|uniref:hypothetical protein n=1 Tax=Streptosporangium sp. 'caverna' TaxID=2202249 RepID=UPI001955050B|nr:hypothetical protein [Streptosporangium sp. 'caverna']
MTLTASALLGGLACEAGAVTGETRTSGSAARTGSNASSGSDLNKTLQELERSYDERIGAVGIDLGTGKTVGYRADERFPFNSISSTALVLVGSSIQLSRVVIPVRGDGDVP